VKRYAKTQDSIKRPNLRIMGIEEEKRYKPKGYMMYSTK
jgi:hypothetical protein